MLLYQGELQAPSIPTLSEWALALLLGMLGMTAMIHLRRRQTA